jgi:hypothetical protein
MTFEHLNTIFHHVRGKHKQPFTFWYCIDNFYPWKDIVGKKVSKLRSVTELRAFTVYSDKKHSCTFRSWITVSSLCTWTSPAVQQLAGGCSTISPHSTGTGDICTAL